jgi:hypothetical protein
MRNWIHDNNNMVRQINIECMQIEPPQVQITPRDEARVLVKNINTKIDSTYNNILSRARRGSPSAS